MTPGAALQSRMSRMWQGAFGLSPSEGASNKQWYAWSAHPTYITKNNALCLPALGWVHYKTRKRWGGRNVMWCKPIFSMAMMALVFWFLVWCNDEWCVIVMLLMQRLTYVVVRGNDEQRAAAGFRKQSSTVWKLLHFFASLGGFPKLSLLVQNTNLYLP